MKALALLALIWFPFAETPQSAQTLRGNIIAVPIATSPVEIDRRCSLPGEMQQCRDYCGRIGGTKRPEAGWNPDAPIPLGTFKAASVGAIFTPAHAVASCDVRTIGGFLTLVCTCFDPSNEA